YMGAWIEMLKSTKLIRVRKVASYMGAWIEMACVVRMRWFPSSHPIWVRGLKCNRQKTVYNGQRVASYMGAWIEIRILKSLQTKFFVASYMGAWIEIIGR